MVNCPPAAAPAGRANGPTLPGRRLGRAAARSRLEGEKASVLPRAHVSRGGLAAGVAPAACSVPTPGQRPGAQELFSHVFGPKSQNQAKVE